MKVTEDGFVWMIVNKRAKMIYLSGIFEVYALNDDSTESLIKSLEELKFALHLGVKVGIEVGRLTTEDIQKIVENKCD